MSRDFVADRDEESFGEAALKGLFQSSAIPRRCKPLMSVNTHQHFWRYARDFHTMPAKPEVDEIRLSRVLFLLALSVFINYLDRGNLSLAAPLLKNEFQLSATQLGVLLSSFFWTYSIFLPLSG